MHNNRELVSTLNECAAVCNYCAYACLNEENVKMLAECISLDIDCAQICSLTADMAARHSDLTDDIIKVCERACRECAAECEKHAKMHDHCRECAEICRKCEKACSSYAVA